MTEQPTAPAYPPFMSFPMCAWLAFIWDLSATFAALAYHGWNGGHASMLMAAWFVGTAALWALTFLGAAVEDRRVRS